MAAALAAALATKRMAKERQDLEKASNQDKDQDYFVFFQDDNLLQFDAYVIAPDTIYRYRLLKLHFDIPAEYPLKPPKVTFIQHTGERIHPNLYVEGKVCLSILGTWKGEPWAFGMTCNTVLITIRSLLDDEPFKHEPNGHNSPTFNQYVEHSTWKSLLLDYLDKETNPAAKAWLDSYVHKNGEAMLRELSRLHQVANANKLTSLTNAYNSRKSIPVDHPSLINTMKTAISASAARQGLPSSAHDSSQAPGKRKAGASEVEDENEAEKKRAKPSAAAKPRPTPEIIDLT